MRVAAILLASLAMYPFVSKGQTGANVTTVPAIVAYEKVCVQNLRTLNVAQISYRAFHERIGYAKKIEQLGPNGDDLIEPVLASGKKDGYRYVLTTHMSKDGTRADHYTIRARPIKRLAKNQKSYFTDETGIIRFTQENRPATVSDPGVDER